MRVVALVPGDRFSGPAGQVASTGPELATRGVDLRFALLCRPGDRTDQLPAFLTRLGLGCEIVTDRGPLDLGLPRRVRTVLEAWRPHVVETHGYKATAVALTLHRRATWRWVGYFHGFTSESVRAAFYHRLDQRMLRHADAVVAVSDEQRRILARRIPGVRVIPNAVTLGQDRSAAPPAWLAAVEAMPRPRLGVVGRLSPEKGVDVFLQASHRLAERGIAHTGIIAGQGPAQARLERLCGDLGLADRIRFIGYQSDVQRLYGALDVLVIPSRSEGLPSVLLEALAADVAVVSTRVGSIPDVLRDGAAGVLVPPDSPDALADGIAAALAGLDSAETARARAEVARAYSQASRANALLSLYRDLGVSSHRVDAD